MSPETPRKQQSPLRLDQHQGLVALADRLNTGGPGEPVLTATALLRAAVDLLLGVADKLPAEDISTEAGVRDAALSLLAVARYDISGRKPSGHLEGGAA